MVGGGIDYSAAFQRAIELIGKRWTGAVVKALLPGPARFNQLLAGIPGISDRVLTERLRELETEGIVERLCRVAIGDCLRRRPEGQTCRACGSPLPHGAVCCPSCGVKTDDPQAEPLHIVDRTTGLFNDRFVRPVLEDELARAHRYQRNLGVLLIEANGSLPPDEALKAMAPALAGTGPDVAPPRRPGPTRPLRPRGEEHARALGRRLAGIQFDAVYSSPLQRARRTAELAGFPDPLLTSLLREVDYGTYEGLTTRQILESDPGWELYSDGCPGGETPAQIYARASEFIALATRQDEGRVLVFAHGHIMRAIAVAWIRADIKVAAGLQLDVATLSMLRDADRGRVIALWNAS